MSKGILVKTSRKDYLFLTLEEEGKKTYYLNGEAVPKEEGNELYLELKRTTEINDIVMITEENKKDVMEYFLRGYDKYYIYIDDYRQYSRQGRINEEVYAYASLINKCIEGEGFEELRNKYVW